MKHLLLAAGLLVGFSSQGQANPSPPPATLSTAPALGTPPAAASAPIRVALDTAAALHRYFARRRHNGHVTLGVGAGLLVAGYATAAINNKGGDLASFLVGALGTVISVPFLVRGIVLTVQHSNGQEQRVVQAWQQHHLPDRWARRALVFDIQPKISR